MNKFLKIFCINILVLLCCCFVLEAVSFGLTQAEYKYKISKYFKQIDYKPLKYDLKMKSAAENLEYELRNEIRTPEGLTSNKKSIVLFGCSFTYGMNLKQEQTLGHKLHKITARPVYNRGINGKGIQQMYYQLNSDDFYKSIKPAPECIMYIFVYHLHNTRLYEYTFEPYENFFNLRYYSDKLDNDGNLVEKNPLLPKYLNGLYSVKNLEHLKVLYDTSPLKKKDVEDFMFLTFQKSYEKAKEHYPNVNFAVFCFDTYPNQHDNHDEFLDRLKSIGITVVKMNEISDIDFTEEKYHINADDSHPNELLWEELAPKLVERLEL